MLRLLPAPACIYTEGKIRYANPAMIRLLGADSAHELAGRSLLELVNAPERPQFQSAISRVLSGEVVPPVRNRLLRERGGPVEVDITSSLIDYDGRPAILGVFAELRKECNEGLRAERQSRRLNRILESAPAAILLARPSGKVEYVNRHFQDVTGLQLRNAVGFGWFAAVEPDDRTRCVECWNASMETGDRFDAEFRLRNPDGTSRWYRATASPLRDSEGRIVRWCAVATDVEDYKRGQAALEISEGRFHRLFEGNLVGLALGNGEQVQEANDQFLRILGRTRVELENGGLSWGEVIPPEEDELGRRKLAEVFTGGEVPAFETAFLRKDGSRVPVLVAGMLLARDPEPRVMALTVDLTERRQLQEIRAETVKLEAVSILAAGMAHNLNNLLTAVIGNASLLLDQHIGKENQRGYALARDIIGAGERAAALISKLLSCAGQGRYALSATDAGALLAAEVERLRQGLAANITMHFEIATPLGPVRMAAEPLRQIIEGLVTNAAEAIGTREGGEVRVALRMEYLSEQSIGGRFPAERLIPGEYCVLEVRDNGSGMDAATLSRAFDPFFTTKFTGRGLGLAAIAGTVRVARGAIRVWTTPGAGTLFRVFLPVAETV